MFRTPTVKLGSGIKCDMFRTPTVKLGSGIKCDVFRIPTVKFGSRISVHFFYFNSICTPQIKFFSSTEDPICASKLKPGWLVVSMGGADLHEGTQVVARGIYPRGGKDLHQDPEERFKLVRSKHRSFLFFELSKRQSKIRKVFVRILKR